MSIDLYFRPSPRKVAVTKESSSTQLIDELGNLNASSLHKFVQSVRLPGCNVSYAVVAIMGPQSSGKSTLLNNLFSTNFDMMDANYGRKQMTKGIWMAKAADVDPLTIVLDIEGNDGKERGAGHPFERQTALFALALADVVIINMWCTDIGREAGANNPLLRIVFEAMVQSFSPCKTTLLFVIRDKTKTPLPRLEAEVKEQLEKIWKELKKPEDRKYAALSDFFKVQVTALCHFEYLPEKFIEEVAELKKLFQKSIAPGGIAGDRKGRVPGSAFSLIVQRIWETIKDNKNLDLPKHKVMVATVRCEEIARDKLEQLRTDQRWLKLKAAAKSHPIPNFGNQMSFILANYLSEYDKETKYFDEGVRDDKRLKFEKGMLEEVHPTYVVLLEHHLSQTKAKFESQLETLLSRGNGFAASVRDCSRSCLQDFDKQCQGVAIRQAPLHWEATIYREELTRSIEAHSSHLRNQKLEEIDAGLRKKLSERLEQTVTATMESVLLEGSNGGSWPWIRKIFKRETEAAASELHSSVSGFEMDETTFDRTLQNLKKYARSIVEKKAKDEGKKAFSHMKNRFIKAFSLHKDNLPRQWTADENIRDVIEEAQAKSLKILSELAIVRLEETPDNIEETLFSCLMNESVNNPCTDGDSGDPLAMKAWEKVSPAITIIEPTQCKNLWRQLIQESGNTISQAYITQDTNKARDAALEAAENARKEVDARLQEAQVASRAEAAAIGALARAEAALQVVKADAAVQAAIAQAEIAAAVAETAKARARARAAKAEIARGNFDWCDIS